MVRSVPEVARYTKIHFTFYIMIPGITLGPEVPVKPSYTVLGVSDSCKHEKELHKYISMQEETVHILCQGDL